MDDAYQGLLLVLQRQIHVSCVRILFEMLRLIPMTDQGARAVLTGTLLDIPSGTSLEFVSTMIKRAQKVSLEDEEPIKEVQAIWKASAGPTEHCPACKATVPFEDALLAKCENGHYWSRTRCHSRVRADIWQVDALQHRSFYQLRMFGAAFVAD